MEWKSNNFKVRLLARRSKDDPEKTLLPTILYINTNNKCFENDRAKGFALILGWWDFSIGFWWIF